MKSVTLLKNVFPTVRFRTMSFAFALTSVATFSGCNTSLTSESTLNPSNLQTEETGLVGGTVVSAKTDFRSRSVALISSTIELNGKKGQAACTATVIAPRALLTAAHCVLNSKGIQVRYEAAPDRIHSAKSYHAHSGYSLKKSPDLAVIIMKEDAPQAVQIAELATLETQPLKEAQTLVSYGFGINQVVKNEYFFGMFSSTNKIRDQKLRYATFKVIAARDTNTIKAEDYTSDVIFTQAEQKSLCQGDSGGPTFIARKDKAIVIGVNSFITTELCTSSMNGLADVRYNTEWIRKAANIPSPVQAQVKAEL